jgi:hypothetical protein
LFIQPEAAYPSLAELGELGVAQFRDVRLNDGVSFFFFYYENFMGHVINDTVGDNAVDGKKKFT